MTRRLLATLAAALVAGVAALLGLDAAARAWGNPGAALTLAPAAVFIAQGVVALFRRRPPPLAEHRGREPD